MALASKIKNQTAEGTPVALPHERDETHEKAPVLPEGSRDLMQRAHDDIESGQQDTDLYSQPGLEKPRSDGHRKDKPPR